MAALAKEPPLPENDAATALDIEAAEIIAACDGDAREAVRTLVRFAYLQEAELTEMRATVSHGFAYGRFLPVGEAPKDDTAK